MPGGGIAAADEPASPAEDEADSHFLFPPGPLDAVRVHPPRLRMPCGSSRTVRALGVDASGRAVEEPVNFTWALDESLGTVEAEAPGDRAKVTAGPDEAEGTLWVTARSGSREARLEVPVIVEEESPFGRGDEGIPEPEFVDHPGAGWRSRMIDGRWEVNAGHREYRAIADRPALKLRYLAMLFAKEVVLESHQDPRLGSPLEQLVEVAAFADRKLSVKGRKRKGNRG